MNLRFESSDKFSHEIQLLATVMIVTGICVMLALMTINAPYGKYASSSWGIGVPAQVAWFVQEFPALSIPLYYWYKAWYVIRHTKFNLFFGSQEQYLFIKTE